MNNNNRKKIDIGPVLHQQCSLYVRGNRLYARLPDCIGLGRNKYISLGLPTTEIGRSQAVRVVHMMNADLTLGQFDKTLTKYKSVYRRRGGSQVEKMIGSQTTLQEMWKIFCEYEKKSKKESTMYYLETTIGDKIKACPHTSIHNAEAIYEWLLADTTPKYALRVLQKLNLLFKWGVEKNVIEEGTNPYERLVVKIKDDYDTTSVYKSRALTHKEIHIVTTQIMVDYQPLVKLHLLLGCRPSEAIGLCWDDVDFDKGCVTLGRSYIEKNAVIMESDNSKNGTRRQFSLYPELREYLLSLPKIGSRVVCYSDGKPYKYNLYYKAWKRVLPKDTTPYCCRDTFISVQVEKGFPLAVVGKWCDNSARTIEKHYLDLTGNLQPSMMEFFGQSGKTKDVKPIADTHLEG